ncbi:hypothetical protein [Streptomyces hirsutus]
MRIMLDNNIWSYLGDERAGKRFKAIAESHLPAIGDPHSDVI